MKSFYGDNATAENQWCYDWLPKWDKSYDCMAQAEMMEQGAINGALIQGFNLLAAAFPDKNKAFRALSPEIYGGDRSTQHRNRQLQAISRRVQRCRPVADRHRSVPLAFFLFRRRRWIGCQLLALVAVALGRGRAPGEALHDGKILGNPFLRLR